MADCGWRMWGNRLQQSSIGVESFDPHPALRATLSQWERDRLKTVPLLWVGGAKRRVRVEGLPPVTGVFS
jgi:hypothetical protein